MRPHDEERTSGSRKLDDTIESPSGLKNAEETADTLATPSFETTSIDPAQSEAAGAFIGRYELMQRIGEGGFGSVFMAQQREPVTRVVALKIIKLGMDSRQVIGRFAQEQQALARMDHPNVAKVFDAGMTESGRPYFVMELCRGEQITNYCDKYNLTISQRLDLFIQVCQAIQHAHQKGLIHRDIKPSNILVSEQDGRPVAKVIDFGIAKATDARLSADPIFTLQQQLIGTPQYMSPEQAEGSLDIDTRSDVYSLGVVLYELLTGSTPFDQKSLKSSSVTEIQRLIREVEPPRPSDRAESRRAKTKIVDEGESNRSRELRGELDWIVMRAIEKDRTRRYESASELAADVDRYLRGQPVIAVPPSVAYRFRKFVRRNRAFVLASGAVVLALIAGTGIATIGFISAIRSRDAEAAAKGDAIAQKLVADRAREDAVAALRAAEKARTGEKKQRDIAENNAAEAAAVNEFLLKMLGSANLRELGRDAKVSQAMDRAGASVGEAFADRPKLECAIRSVLAKTYLSLGMTGEAMPHVERAIEISREQSGEASEGFGRLLILLGYARMQRGELPAAIKTYERAIDTLSNASGANAKVTISARVDYANALMREKQYDEAEKIFREVLASRQDQTDEDRRDSLIALNSLAVLLHTRNRFDEAEPLYRQAAETGERVLGPDHPDTLTARLNMASLMNSRGARAEAEPLLRQGYEDIRRVFGENHEKTGQAASACASCLDAQGRIAEAIPYYEVALRVVKSCKNPGTLDVASAQSNLADANRRAGDANLAVSLQKEVVETYTMLAGPESVTTLEGKIDLANMLVTAKQTDEAESLFRELLTACPRVLGEGHPKTLRALTGFSVLLMQQDKYGEAVPYLRRSLDVGRRVDGEDALNTIITEHNLVCALRESGGLQEAGPLADDTLARFRKVMGPRHNYTGVVLGGHAEVLWKLGRLDEAQREFREAIDIGKAAGGPRNRSSSAQSMMLGQVMLEAGDVTGAEKVLREAADDLLALRGADNVNTIRANLYLGRTLLLQKRFAESEPLLSNAQTALAKSNEPMAKQLLPVALQSLAQLYGDWNTAEPNDERTRLATEWTERRDKAATSQPSGN